MKTKMMKMKKKLFAILALMIANAPAVPALAREQVNPQITDAVTQVRFLENLMNLQDKLAQSDVPDNMLSKIGQSDVPDNMLSLLAALRASTQSLKLANSDVPDNMMAALKQETNALIQWLVANPKDSLTLERLAASDLGQALEEGVATM